QKAYEQLLVKHRAEQAFKAEICMWIYVFLCHNAIFYHSISKFTAFSLINQHRLLEIKKICLPVKAACESGLNSDDLKSHFMLL
ncbi:hypothetical protein, partial [Prevotella sp.]|uniref:hypothetical protein n=1 Tax=Prevotella sp. TaxID=59823 RepID=UPI0025CCBE44